MERTKMAYLWNDKRDNYNTGILAGVFLHTTSCMVQSILSDGSIHGKFCPCRRIWDVWHPLSDGSVHVAEQFDDVSIAGCLVHAIAIGWFGPHHQVFEFTSSDGSVHSSRWIRQIQGNGDGRFSNNYWWTENWMLVTEHGEDNERYTRTCSRQHWHHAPQHIEVHHNKPCSPVSYMPRRSTGLQTEDVRRPEGKETESQPNTHYWLRSRSVVPAAHSVNIYWWGSATCKCTKTLWCFLVRAC